MVKISNRQSMDSDFMREPVPIDRAVGWPGIAVVIFSIGVTLPVFFLGSELMQALGLVRGATAFMLGCVIVGLMMMATSVVAARTRLSTYMVLQFSFGNKGVKPVNALLAITYIGWFAATGDIFGSAIHDSLLAFYDWNVPAPLCAAVGSVAMALTAVFGFRVVERFSMFAVPILTTFMIFVVYVATKQMDWQSIRGIPGQGNLSFGYAVSAVIGGNILMAVGAPDFTRYSKNERDALKTVSGLVFGYPLIMLVSGISTLVTGESDIMKIMISLNVAVPALVILVFATWTTNTVNLYSGILTLATVANRTSTRKIALASSIVGIAGAVLGVMDFFLPFVFFLGIATAPIAGIYLADFFIIHKGSHRFEELESVHTTGINAYIAWLIGSGAAYLTTYSGLAMTTVPAVDGLLVAFLSYIVITRLRSA